MLYYMLLNYHQSPPADQEHLSNTLSKFVHSSTIMQRKILSNYIQPTSSSPDSKSTILLTLPIFFCCLTSKTFLYIQIYFKEKIYTQNRVCLKTFVRLWN